LFGLDHVRGDVTKSIYTKRGCSLVRVYPSGKTGKTGKPGKTEQTAVLGLELDKLPNLS
jgi:hypothetical protein